MEPLAAQLAAGRVYAARRIVRSTDVTPSRRLRLDALARYLQMAAEDDLADSGLADSGLAEPVLWLARRCELDIRELPAMGERLTITTFCSGTGPRWAERTTTIAAGDRALVQARAVWAVVAASGRPVPLSAGFLRVYGESAGGRVVSARLSHRRPDGTDSGGNGAAGGLPPRDWPLRATDFDIAGHVTNAVYWAVVEDELAATGWLPAVAEMEFHRAIEPGCTPRLVTDRRAAETLIWLLDAGRVLASARLSG